MSGILRNMAKRATGATRRHGRRLRLKHEKYLRRYGYLSEWNAEYQRWKREKLAEAAKP